MMILDGDLKGCVFKVDKLNKAEGVVILETGSGSRRELVINVCIVEDHFDTGCTCSHLP
jgi:hypothetical protein